MKRIYILLIAIIFVGSILGCGLISGKGDAEKVAESFFRDRITNGGFAGHDKYYSDIFWQYTDEENWGNINHMVDKALGNLNSYSLKSWKAQSKVQVKHLWGTFVVLVYDTQYEKGSGQEKLTMYKGDNEADFLIMGNRINSPKIQKLKNKGIISQGSSEALSEGPKDNDITDLYNNILIGELFPSGNVYLERISLDGGYDNQQNFEGLKYSKQLEIYPIKKANWISVRASFSRLIKETYIGKIEKTSKYFIYPFSQYPQDALLYKAEKNRTDKPMTMVSINNYQIEKIIYFGDSDKREYSHTEYKAAMEHIRRDHERKDKYDSDLIKITKAHTILNARKIALFSIKNVDYDVLLSLYSTHGIEYASDVYVIDFIKDGKIILTKRKYNTDGPY